MFVCGGPEGVMEKIREEEFQKPRVAVDCRKTGRREMESGKATPVCEVRKDCRHPTGKAYTCRCFWIKGKMGKSIYI